MTHYLCALNTTGCSSLLGGWKENESNRGGWGGKNKLNQARLFFLFLSFFFFCQNRGWNVSAFILPHFSCHPGVLKRRFRFWQPSRLLVADMSASVCVCVCVCVCGPSCCLLWVTFQLYIWEHAEFSKGCHSKASLQCLTPPYIPQSPSFSLSLSLSVSFLSPSLPLSVSRSVNHFVGISFAFICLRGIFFFFLSPLALCLCSFCLCRSHNMSL